MTFQLPPDATYPTPDEIRDRMLRAVRFTYLRLGINRNVLPGSDDYVRCDKLAGRVGIAIANNQISAANSDPLTATGDALVKLAAVFGVYPRPAAGAAGPVNILFAGSSVTLPSGWTGTAPDGHKFLAAAGNYATGVQVPITAIDTGASTNEATGTVITWDSAGIGALSPSATVATGLTGGVDADDQETLRQRLLRRLAAAAVGGNWSSVVEWAEDASAAVQQAYCYPAAEGASSYDVAVTAVGGDRTLPKAITDALSAAVLAQMPGEEQLNLTTVTPQPVDISLATRLPLPQAAGGVGGGWRDVAPWPAENCKITAFNSGSQTATVNSAAAPSVGSSIGIWDPTYTDPVTLLVVGRMVEYSVATVSGTSGAWTFTVQGTFGGRTPTGQYVSAGANYLVDYADAFAGAARLLGPGQKTTMPELLPRATRQPSIDVSSPSDLTSRLLDAVQEPFSEIEDLEWGVRFATGTTTPLTSPSLPTTTADPPRILVLKSIAFRYEP